jgi:hypothetical protein
MGECLAFRNIRYGASSALVRRSCCPSVSVLGSRFANHSTSDVTGGATGVVGVEVTFGKVS